MFASLPKLADRAFLIGFGLPVLLFQLAAAFLLGGREFVESTLTGGLEQTTATAVGLLFSAWVGATILVVFNYWIYRAMEGYIGPFKSAIWLDNERLRFQRANLRVDAAEAQFDQPDPAAVARARTDYLRGLRELATDFPDREALLLPTRFGNRVRAFETYPYVVYGVDSIPIWLRLQGVMDKEAHAAIAEARSRVDFFVNLWLLSAALAIVMGPAAAWSTTFGWHGFSSLKGTAYAAWASATLLAWLSYRGALAMAVSWGDQVKTSFDLYLPALAQQLGFRVPSDPAEARKFWGAINEMCLYCRPVDSTRWLRTDAAPSRRGRPAAGPDNDDDATG